MLPDKLTFHAFPIAVWKEASTIQKNLKDQGLNPDLEDIDEYQFYVMRVGYALAHLITWLEQIDHAVYYLSDFSYKKEAKEEGINRARHLLYSVENYLIRLQSVYDRALQLTNNVFHLCVEESNVQHLVIINNLKVSRTDIPVLLKTLKKELSNKAQERNEIIHRNSHQDDNLRRLELFYMFDNKIWKDKADPYLEEISSIRSQLVKRVVTTKKKEFAEINERVFSRVDDLLTGLQKQYDKEAIRLRAYVYGSNT